MSWSLPAALLFVCLSTAAAQSGVLRRVVNDADWSARSESSAYSNPLPQLVSTFDGHTLIPAGSVWVYGGVDPDINGLSDTWVTTDSAKSWMQVESARTVTDFSRTADCYSHQTGRVYALTGSEKGSGDTRTARIVASNDGANWEVLSEDAGFLPRERPGCTVDSQGNVFIFGGSTRSNDGGSTSASNDIWWSRNLGSTWQRLTQRAPWTPRISTDTQTYASTVFNKDLIYVANGDGGRTYGFQNDVWVSSDSARSWSRLVSNTTYPYRKDAELSIANNGVMVVSGGDNDASNVNDVWASLDGGYTWGACCTQCGYEIREDHFGGFDVNGYYMLMGGIGKDNDVFNDVWKSTFSFHDVASVARSCNLQVPAAGVGLTCFPNGNGGCTADSPGSPPGVTPSASSGLSGAMIAGIVFGVVIVVALVALVYRYKTKKQGEGMLPSFGGSKSTSSEHFILGTTSTDV